jgi:hypothetical protein
VEMLLSAIRPSPLYDLDLFVRQSAKPIDDPVIQAVGGGKAILVKGEGWADVGKGHLGVCAIAHLLFERLAY